MKLSDAVMDAMSEIDESWLKQSEEYKASRGFAWKPVLSFAAVIVLLFAVIIRMPKSGSSAPSLSAPANNAMDSSRTDSAQETMDGISGSLVYDEELLAYLDTVSDDTMVTIVIETGEAKHADLQASQFEADVLAPVTMTKEEILNFEPEAGMTYIFHLYTEDESE